jgi:hypothetical protein
MIRKTVFAGLLLFSLSFGCGKAADEQEMSDADSDRVRECFVNCVAADIQGWNLGSDKRVSGTVSAESCRSPSTLSALDLMLQDGVLQDSIARSSKMGPFMHIHVRSNNDEIVIKCYDQSNFVGFAIVFPTYKEHYYRMTGRHKIQTLIDSLVVIQERLFGEHER